MKKGMSAMPCSRKMVHIRYMKKGMSAMPCNCALNPFILELSDSADALVALLIK